MCHAALSALKHCVHGQQGNLEWMAAFEVEPATESMYMNCWKEEKTLTPEVAGRRLRGAVTDAIQVANNGTMEPIRHWRNPLTTGTCAAATAPSLPRHPATWRGQQGMGLSQPLW